jgi:hypothetical protein
MKENKTFQHLMLDIETMGTKSFSSILSIGAVEFDLDTGDTGAEFYVNVDFQSCLDAGLTIDASTVMWWMSQSDEARSKLSTGDVKSIENALHELAEFCNYDYQVWGNSARFDCGIINDAYSKIGAHLPWSFWNERDVRTLVSFNPSIKSKMTFKGTAHNAIDDCLHQISYCSKIWNSLKK